MWREIIWHLVSKGGKTARKHTLFLVHRANHRKKQTERTFLAWLRTSLAFASIGIGITQLFRLNTTLNPGGGGGGGDSSTTPPPSTTIPVLRLRTVGKPLGVTFLAVSIVILCLGWRRYFEAQYWIIRGKFPASRGSVFLVTFVAAALIVVSLAVVVIVGNGM